MLGAGLYMARRASSGRPSKLQLAFETIVDAIEKQVASSMGQVAPFVVPLAVTLFLYILIANWIGLIPTRGNLEPPSADINFTLALALTVIVWMHITAIRKKGLAVLPAPLRAAVPRADPARDHRARSSSRSRWPCDSSATSSPATSCSRSSA